MLHCTSSENKQGLGMAVFLGSPEADKYVSCVRHVSSHHRMILCSAQNRWRDLVVKVYAHCMTMLGIKLWSDDQAQRQTAWALEVAPTKGVQKPVQGVPGFLPSYVFFHSWLLLILLCSLFLDPGTLQHLEENLEFDTKLIFLRKPYRLRADKGLAPKSAKLLLKGKLRRKIYLSQTLSHKSPSFLCRRCGKCHPLWITEGNVPVGLRTVLSSWVTEICFIVLSVALIQYLRRYFNWKVLSSCLIGDISLTDFGWLENSTKRDVSCFFLCHIFASEPRVSHLAYLLCCFAIG